MRRFVNNQCSEHDLEQLFSYIKKHPQDPLLHKIMDEDAATEAASGKKLTKETSAKLKEQLRQKLFKTERFISSPQLLQPKMYWRVAAVFIPLVICLGFFYVLRNAKAEIIVKTSFGQVKTITLPDNSEVILNANSTLLYSQDWKDDKPREVTLYGEGYFKVVHQHNHAKFLVHTSNKVVIEVLGTQFNVNNRRDRTRVVLQSGKIKLGIENKNLNEILMRAGDYAEVNSHGNLIRKAVDTQQYTSWKSKKLIFKDTPLKEIIAVLEDSYGYKAEIRDSVLLNETFTATYPADDVDVLLNALSKSFKITANPQNKEIIIGI